MTVPPDPTPKTVPVPDPTVATPNTVLVHVPPDGEELNVVVNPTHTVGVPVMVPGVVLTVTNCVTKQLPTVYVIFAVPTLTLVTTPVPAPTLATAVFPLVHVPPEVVVLNSVDPPIHIAAVPVIAAGVVLTVTIKYDSHPAPSE